MCLSLCASVGDFDYVKAGVFDGGFNSGVIRSGAGYSGHIVLKGYGYASDAGKSLESIVYCLYAVLAVHTADENCFDYVNQSFQYINY